MDYLMERKLPAWVGAFPWTGIEVSGRLSAMKGQTLASAKTIAKECLLADGASRAWIVNSRGDRLFITRRTR